MKTSAALSILAACGLGVASLGVAAAATPESDAPSVTVHYGDLNLSTDQGTRELYRRLSGAATLVCPNLDRRDLQQSIVVARCRAEAIDKAVKTINNAHLAEIASGRNRTG